MTSPCVSICLHVSSFVPMCLHLSPCVPVCLNLTPCVYMCLHLSSMSHLHVTMLLHVTSCDLMLPHVSQCIPLFLRIHESPFIPLCLHDGSMCFHMSPCVFICSHVSPFVSMCSCISMLSQCVMCLHVSPCDDVWLTMFQAWVLALVCVLTSLTPLEAAKGSLRAGVLSRSWLRGNMEQTLYCHVYRGGMRRSKNRNYGHDMDWDQRGESTAEYLEHSDLCLSM